MPELPDVVVYIEAIEKRVLGEVLGGVRLGNLFVLRTVDPPPAAAAGRTVRRVRRIGKRIAIEVEGDIFLVIHLMIAGRLHWKAPAAKLPGKHGLAAFDFASGSLLLTEAGSKRRACLHCVHGEPALRELDRGGIEPLEAEAARFEAALRRENHTLKRALTDPSLFSGIGNAYSDEILHRARLSPVRLTHALTPEEVERLHRATIETLTAWTERLRREAGDSFPEHVTAFREGMAVHGRFGKPCPVCAAPVQRIAYADNETNYCPNCQTGGRLLADRALSRLLKQDWPRSLEEMEQLRERHSG